MHGVAGLSLRPQVRGHTTPWLRQSTRPAGKCRPWCCPQQRSTRVRRAGRITHRPSSDLTYYNMPWPIIIYLGPDSARLAVMQRPGSIDKVWSPVFYSGERPSPRSEAPLARLSRESAVSQHRLLPNLQGATRSPRSARRASIMWATRLENRSRGAPFQQLCFVVRRASRYMGAFPRLAGTDRSALRQSTITEPLVWSRQHVKTNRSLTRV